MRDPPGRAEASLPSADVIPSRESGVEPARGFGSGVAIKDADTAHEDAGLEPGSVSPRGEADPGCSLAVEDGGEEI